MAKKHYIIRGGIDSSSLFKKEDEYGEEPINWTEDANHFGLSQSVTPSASRDLTRRRGLAGVLPSDNLTPTSRDTHKLLAGKTELSMDVEYEVQHFDFLEHVWGSKSTDGAITYYPQHEAIATEDKKKYLTAPSLSIAQRYDFGGVEGDTVDAALIFTGLKVNTWEISASIGEPCTVSTNLMGSDILYKQDGVGGVDIHDEYPGVALSARDIYHFVDSDIVVGEESIDNAIDGFTFNVENNAEGIGDIREYVNVAVVLMGRNFNLTIDMNLENLTYIKKLIGSSDGISKPILIDTITLKLKKDDFEEVRIIMKDLGVNEGLPGQSYGEVSKNNLNLIPKYAYVEVEDLSYTT